MAPDYGKMKIAELKEALKAKVRNVCDTLQYVLVMGLTN